MSCVFVPSLTLFFFSPVHFEFESKQFTWRTNDARRIAVRIYSIPSLPEGTEGKLNLYSDETPDVELASFQCSQRTVPHRRIRGRRALLHLHADALEEEGLLDRIIVSLIVVEQELRRKETRYRNSDMGYLMK